ncbi:MAG: hypothetical protein H0X36_00635 [Sphingomonadaceae bacterium]|nr:hypothetical protein [Sphingomonadaceae bacterium]
MADSPVPKPRQRATPTATGIQVGATPAAAPKGAFDQAREQVSGMAEEATTAVRKAANQGKDKAAEALGGLSKLADDAARTIDDRIGGGYGDYARKASTTVQDFASTLQSKDIDDLVADTKAFVRKSPVVAIGAAAAVGFLLTRLFKAGTSDGRA